MKFERTQRIGEEIKKIITKMLIEGQIKNSVILNTRSLISVVDVSVVRDLKYAYVYISVLGGGKDDIIEALKKSAGFIRREVGKHIKLRYTPELMFLSDESIKYGVEMIKKIDEVTSHDENISINQTNEDN